MTVTRRASIRTTMFAIISLLNILIAAQAGSSLWRSWNNYGLSQQVKQASSASNLLYGVEKRLSQERGAAIPALYTPPADMTPFTDQMEENRSAGDRSLDTAIKMLQNQPEAKAAIERIHLDRDIFLNVRREVDAALVLPVGKRDPKLADRAFDATSNLINSIRDLIEDVSRPILAFDPVLTLQLRFKYYVWQVTEDTGKEYAMIARLIAENKIASPETLAQLLTLQGRADLGWENVRAISKNSRLSAAVIPNLEEAETHYFMTFDQIKGLFYLPRKDIAGARYPITTEVWIELASQATDSLFALKDFALAETQKYADQMADKAENAIAFNVCLFLAALILGAYSWYVIAYRVAKPVNAMADALYKATHGEAEAGPSSGDEIGKLAFALDAFRKTSEERERYLHDLEKSNRELDDFAYIASHDLKEPLRGLHNFSRFLLEDYGDKVEEEGKNMLETIAALTQRMEGLLNSLLHYSRLGRTELSVRETDLNEVVKNIGQMLSITLQEKNARIVVPSTLPNVVCDHIRVAEALQNLIGNALKYNDSPEKVIEVGVTRTHPRVPNRTVFYVRDNGIGIEERHLDAIFRIFHRLHPRDAYGGGTGSGLTIAKKIISQHHGEIWAESEGKGKGTTFYFTL